MKSPWRTGDGRSLSDHFLFLKPISLKAPREVVPSPSPSRSRTAERVSEGGPATRRERKHRATRVANVSGKRRINKVVEFICDAAQVLPCSIKDDRLGAPGLLRDTVYGTGVWPLGMQRQAVDLVDQKNLRKAGC